MRKRFDIPPILSLTFFLSLGITFGFYCKYSISIYVISSLIVLQLAIFFLRKKITYFHSIFFIVSCIIFSCLGILSMAKHHIKLPENFIDKPCFIEAKVCQILKPNVFQNRYEIESIAINNQPNHHRFILRIDKKKFKRLEKLDHFKCVGKISELQKNQTFGGFDYTNYMNKKGIIYQLSINQIIVKNMAKTNSQRFFSTKDKLTDFINQSTLSNESKDIIKALTLGEKLEMNESILQSFSNTGIIHILAISGLHIGMISAMLLWLLKPLKSFRRYKYLPLILAFFALWIYAYAVGFTPSVVRAVTMFSFINFGLMIGRSSSIINTIAASILILLVFNPYYLFDVGFQLSYSAVLSIVLFYPIFKKWYYPKTKIYTYFYDILLVSLAAQLGVLPISLYYFHQLPGLFLVANLLAIPMLTILLILGFLFVFLAFFKIEITWFSNVLDFVISHFIQAINYLSSYNQFIWKDIYLSTINLFASIVLILMLYAFLYSKKTRFLSFSFILIIFMQCSFLINKYVLISKPQFVLFQKNDEFAVFQNDSQNLFFFSTNHTVFVQEKTLIKQYFYAKNIIKKPFRNFYQHQNNKIFLINQSNLNLNQFPADILIFPKGVFYNKDRFSKNLNQKFYLYSYKEPVKTTKNSHLNYFGKTLVIK